MHTLSILSLTRGNIGAPLTWAAPPVIHPYLPSLSARIYSYKPAAQFVVAQTPLETRNKTRVHFAGGGNEKFGYSVGSDFLVMKTCCCRQEKTPRVNFNKISKLSYPRFFRKETFPLKSFHEIFIWLSSKIINNDQSYYYYSFKISI